MHLLLPLLVAASVHTAAGAPAPQGNPASSASSAASSFISTITAANSTGLPTSTANVTSFANSTVLPTSTRTANVTSYANSTTATSTASSVTAATSTPASSSASVTTAVPSPSPAIASPLTNYSLPPRQAWCNGVNGSQIFCPGRILQTVELAQPYADSKTFVDKPTKASEQEVVAAFDRLVGGSNGSYQGLVQWLDQYFDGEGINVVPATLADFNANPNFLDYIKNPLLKGWLKIVHGYWRDLARQSKPSAECPTCVSTLIDLPNTFIVPGGRFRENYYWDTYFALQGILIGGLQTTANQTIQNYLYLLETYGFIPNGARIYYLNRSQPPLFTQMLYTYVTATNDTSFLPRALKLVETEMKWWDTNRSVSVTAPSGKKYTMHQYRVNTSAPRPESYLEDWEAVNGDVGGTLIQSPNTKLYTNLSSGAESGMDYSATRWSTRPLANVSNTNAPLRYLDIDNLVPVDLNAILVRDYEQLSKMYKMTGNYSGVSYWQNRSDSLKAAVLDVHWDPQALLFKDFNLTSSKRHDVWSMAAYYPYWSGIFPSEVTSSQTNAQKAMSGLAYITSHYNGSLPTSLLKTGQQWDFPNVWPPTVYIALEALRNLPSNVSSGSFDTYSQQVLNVGYLPSGHFGLNQSALPQQSVLGPNTTNITSVSSFSQLGNVGNVSNSGYGWRDGLAVAVANRYTSSFFCTWYSLGGSIPGVLNRLSDQDLQVTNSVNSTGQMVEKSNALDVDAAGGGGEYTVQAGFAWTNGVAIWIGRNFGDKLIAPSCPALSAEASTSGAMAMHRDFSLRPNLAARALQK